MADMKIEARAAFIAQPAELLKELIALGDADAAVDLVRKYTLLLSSTELIPYNDLAQALEPKRLIDMAADRVKHEMAMKVLQNSGIINLSKEGEWPT